MLLLRRVLDLFRRTAIEVAAHLQRRWWCGTICHWRHRMHYNRFLVLTWPQMLHHHILLELRVCQYWDRDRIELAHVVFWLDRGRLVERIGGIEVLKELLLWLLNLTLCFNRLDAAGLRERPLQLELLDIGICVAIRHVNICLLYTSPSPRDA